LLSVDHRTKKRSKIFKFRETALSPFQHSLKTPTETTGNIVKVINDIKGLESDGSEYNCSSIQIKSSINSNDIEIKLNSDVDSLFSPDIATPTVEESEISKIYDSTKSVCFEN
jgi:hypothetical protein